MKTIYINDEDFDTNVAIEESGKLINYFTEKNVYARAGNIYKGRISKLVSNMNFVFVEIGDEKPAFLSEKEYFDFAGPDYGQIFNDETGPMDIKPQDNITGIFEKGQELIVQVIKEPYNTKGARLTTNVMLPGHYVVYSPFLKHAGVSRRITDEDERHRLRSVIDKAKESLKGEFGVIVRTQAQGVKSREIEKELNAHHEAWQKIKKSIRKRKAPALLYEEQDLPVKTLREHLDENVGEIIVDSEKVYKRVKAYLKLTKKKSVKLTLYDGVDSLPEYYKIQGQIDGLYNSIVPFKKGGYIKIDVTEALTVIDINSGKFKGLEDVESSLLHINTNAAKEIARQIILRNIGGLIVVDFIDMQKDESKQKVKEVMDEELAKSKLYFKTTKISEFGLMEVTRKRDSKKIEDMYFEHCGACGGRGLTLRQENVCINWIKKIKYMCRKELDSNVSVLLPAGIKDMIEKEHKKVIDGYSKRFKKNIILKSDS